jgi:hypothetical protein
VLPEAEIREIHQESINMELRNSGSIENRMESGSGYCARDDEGAF